MKEMVVGVAALGLLLVAHAHAQKAEVRLNRGAVGPRYAQFPKVCADGDRVFVVYNDDRNGPGDLFFQRSMDRGETWLEADIRLDADIPGIGHSLEHQIARSGETLYVVWREYSSPATHNFYMNMSRDLGETWLKAPLLVGISQAPGTRVAVPSICADELGVYLAFVAVSPSPNGDARVFFNRSLDGGATWLSSDVLLSAPGLNPPPTSLPVIAGGGDGVVYVAWGDYRRGMWDIFFDRTLDAGQTWLPAQIPLSTKPSGAGNAVLPQIVAEGHSVYVAWVDDRDKGPFAGGADIYFNSSSDRGATWRATDVRLDTDVPGAAASSWPDLSVDGQNVYVVWEDERLSVRPARAAVFLNWSADGGDSWQASDIQVSLGAASTPRGRFGSLASYPKVASENGLVLVAWNEDRGGFEDVYCNRSVDEGKSWLREDVRLETGAVGAAVSTYAEVAMGSDHAYVVWVDDRDARSAGRTDVYFNVPFALHSYGEGTVGASDCAPELSGSGFATIGSTVQLSITDAPVSDLGVLAVGTTPRVTTPTFGGTLHLNPLMVLPVTVHPDGRATLPVPIPDDEALVGEGVLFQFLGIDAAAPAGVSMSNGLELRIG